MPLADVEGGEKWVASATNQGRLCPWKPMVLIVKRCFTAHTYKSGQSRLGHKNASTLVKAVSFKMTGSGGSLSAVLIPFAERKNKKTFCAPQMQETTCNLLDEQQRCVPL